MAGDIVSNTLCHSPIGTGRPALPQGFVLGLTAGVGGVVLPGPLGLGTAPSGRTTQTKVRTAAWHKLGGLVTGAVGRARRRAAWPTASGPCPARQGASHRPRPAPEPGAVNPAATAPVGQMPLVYLAAQTFFPLLMRAWLIVLVTFLFIRYVLPGVLRLVLSGFVRQQVRRAQQHTQMPFGGPFGPAQPPSTPPGQVRVNYVPPAAQPNRPPDQPKAGEYVDFEEV